MRKLDKKTLRSIKVFDAAQDKQVHKTEFRHINMLKHIVRNKKNYSSTVFEAAKADLVMYRGLLKQERCVKVYSLDKHDLSTYYTLKDNGYPKEQGPLDQRRWILRRLKEKLQEKRSQAKVKNSSLKVYKGYAIELIAGVHEESSIFLNLKDKYKVNRLNESKEPCAEFNYIGIELEFFIPHSEKFLKDMLIKHELYEHAEIKYDGSLELDEDDYEHADYYIEDYTAYEVTLLCKESEVYDVISRMCSVLYKVDAYINETCGLHVHFDMRNRNHKKVFTNLCHLQKLLFKMVNEDRQDNSYCRKVTDSDWDTTDRDHYFAINGREAYSRHETIEIRMHHASLDKREISNWIGLLLKVVNHKKLERETDSLATAKEWYRLDKAIVDYYAMRGVS